MLLDTTDFSRRTDTPRERRCLLFRDSSRGFSLCVQLVCTSPGTSPVHQETNVNLQRAVMGVYIYIYIYMHTHTHIYMYIIYMYVCIFFLICDYFSPVSLLDD